MKIFTISSGKTEEGTIVEALSLKGAEVTIPAILIGETGRGRARGVIPVQLSDEKYQEWEEKGTTRISYGELGQTKAGKPKLYEKESVTTKESIIAVFRTKIGFRGSNSHTGDRLGWKCGKGICEATGKELEVPVECPVCGASGSWDGPVMLLSTFPGEVIAEGRIAEGIAGRAGSGSQLIAIMPKDVVFRTGYGGRLYGAPRAHYYKWDGTKIISATWEEREVSDIF